MLLTNYRPICLLNTIYKLASAGIANKLKTVITKLINTDQSGFISGRYIGENTKLVYDLMQFVEEKNIPGLLLLVDFEKAFDSVSWVFIHKVLKFFNFGPSIQKWVSVFLKNTPIRVNQEVTSLHHLDWNVAANKGIQYQLTFLFFVQKY